MKHSKVKQLLAIALSSMLLMNGGAATEVYANNMMENQSTEESTESNSGVLGETINWRLDEEGTLWFSGTGALSRRTNEETWDKKSVLRVVIGEGITSIDQSYFSSFYDKLTSVELPEGMTEIGGLAFYGCEELTNIKLPESMVSIGEQAFRGCSKLSSIEIPKNVTSMETDAFMGCYKLPSINVAEENTCYSSVDGIVYSKDKSQLLICPNGKDIGEFTIPDGVKTVGSYAFLGCGIETIHFPAGLEEIGVHAFSQCVFLKNVVLPEGLKKIEERAFNMCFELNKVYIPKSVDFIGETTFAYCNLENIEVSAENLCYSSENGSLYNKDKTKLIRYANLYSEKVEIPETVTTIGYLAFQFGQMENFEIPKNVETIDACVFQYCGNLKRIKVPKNVKNIGKNLFDSTEGLTWYCYENTVAHTYAVENNIPYVLLEDVGNCSISVSEQSVAYTGSEVKPKLIVKDGTEELVENEDYVVDYRNNVNVGTATVVVTGIGKYWDMGAIEKSFCITTCPLDNTNIKLLTTDYIYDGTEKKPEVVVLHGDKKLVNGKDYAISYENNKNAGTAAVVITGKGNYAGTIKKNFSIVQKPSLSKAQITLSETTCNYNGKEIKPSVIVKMDNKELKQGTDYTVEYENNVNIGTAKVTITGKGTYQGTMSASFEIKASTGSIYTVESYKYKITGSSSVAFAGLKDSKITKVTIPKTVKIGEKTFKVTSVASKALYKKTKVKTVVIGANVKTIGTSAFEKCSKLTQVTVGKNVTKIEASAFKGCKKLSSITIKSTKLKTVGKNAFKGIKKTAKIKVPKKKLNAYKKILKNKGLDKKVKIVK